MRPCNLFAKWRDWREIGAVRADLRKAEMGVVLGALRRVLGHEECAMSDAVERGEGRREVVVR
jgi:hypothetical protein